jgi:2-dehydropantoate 2-reductase
VGPENGGEDLIMRTLIWGAGPVGLYLGVCLKEAGVEVHFLGRRRILEPLKDGFILEEKSKRQEVQGIEAFFDLEEVRGNSYDWAIIAFKSHHNLAVAPQLSTVQAKKILVVQNGVGNEEFFENYHPHVASAAFTKVAHIKGGVLKVSKGGLGLAPEKKVGDIAPIFAIRIEVRVFADYRSMKWSKLLLNILASPIACVLNLPPQDYMKEKKGIKLEKALFSEYLRLIKRMKMPLVSLPGYPVKLLPLLPYLPAGIFRRISKARGEKLPSLLADSREGRPLEIKALLLNPLKEAEKLNYSMPLASLIYKKLEGGQSATLDSLWSEYLKSLQGSFSGSG